MEPQEARQQLERLAKRVIAYFGDGPIDPQLDCDIEVRQMARDALEAVSAAPPQEARQQELLGVLRDTLRYMRGHDYFLDAEELKARLRAEIDKLAAAPAVTPPSSSDSEPERCPTCGSDDPKYRRRYAITCCMDPWHTTAATVAPKESFMNTVHVPAEPGFYLAYKPTQENPSGRAPAKPTRWDTREKAQNALNEMGRHVTPPRDFNDFLHVIEVPAAVAPAGQPTRFADFDDESHPFHKWWNEYGQFMLSGGGRRESIWAARGWIAREQLAEGVEVTGDALREAASPATPEGK